MVRKPRSSPQPLLPFPPDDGDVAVRDDDEPSNTEGNRDEVQNDGSRIVGAATGDVQPAPRATDAADGAGLLRSGAEGEPRSPEGPPVPGEAGQQREPD